MKIHTFFSVALIAALAAHAAPVKEAAVRSSLPIKIGLAVGLSGANSVIAPSVVQSSQLAVEQINATGGILGRQIELEIVDDESGGAGAEKAYEKLLFEKSVSAVISMETSAARSAALPLVSRARVPFIYTSFYEGHACNYWLYVNAWVPEQQVASVVNFLGLFHFSKKYFLIGNDYSFGHGMLQFAKKYIVKQGGTVVGEEYLPVEGSDWTGILAKAKAANADALISATAGGAPNLSLARQIKTAGLAIPYGNLAIDEATAKKLGADGKNMYMSASYFTTMQSSENRRFLESMKKRFGDDLKTPNELSVPQYEAFFLYRAAAEKVGSTNPEKIIQALETVSFNGPRGVVSMDASRHTPLNMHLGQVKGDGSVKVLQTFDNVYNPGTQCRPEQLVDDLKPVIRPARQINKSKRKAID